MQNICIIRYFPLQDGGVSQHLYTEWKAALCIGDLIGFCSFDTGKMNWMSSPYFDFETVRAIWDFMILSLIDISWALYLLF